MAGRKWAMMSLPMSEKQKTLIDDLAAQIGAIPASPAWSMWDASEIIDAYLSRRRHRLFGRAASLRR